MNRRIKVLAASVLAVVLAFGLSACKPENSGDVPPGTDEEWQGNWERPDTPSEPDEPEVHVCNHACFVCGLCLDPSCEEEECKEKCYETDCEGRERSEMVLSGIDERVNREGGVFIEGTHIGGVSQNANMKITWRVIAPEDTVVCLGATVSEMTESNFITSATPITVNGEPFYSRAEVPAGATAWTNFVTSWLGCVTLKEGVNDIVITNPNSSGAYNIQDIRFMTPVELEWADALGRETCTHKNEQGLCTDYDSNKYYCLNKDVTGWNKLNIWGGDDKVLKYNPGGGSLWNDAENEKCIGYIDGANTQQTIIWSFEATEETYVELSLETSVNRGGSSFADLWELTFNDQPIETEGYTVVYAGDTSAGVYATYTFSTVAFVKAQPGLNTFMMVHKNTTMGYNLRSLDLIYQNGTLTAAQAERPDGDIGELPDEPVTEGDTYVFESENATLTSGGSGNMSPQENANASGGVALGNVFNNYNATISFGIYAAADCTAALNAAIAFGAVTDYVGIFTLEVNGESVPVNLTYTPQGTADWSTFEDFWVTNVDLKAGNNTITFTITGGCGNFDCIKLVSPAELTAAKEEPEEPEEPITEGQSYKFNGEDAEFTAGSTGLPSVNNEATADGGVAIGNICNNYNATLTFKVNAAEAGKAGLYMQMALGASPSENILTLTVNGKEVAVPASFTSVGAANWTTYESFWLANVDLVAGENTIVITVTGGCGNFDYLEFISPVEVTALPEEPEEPEEPITEGQSYKFNGEDAEFTAGSTGLPSVNNEATADGGVAIGNICNNYNATLTFKVNAAEAGKAGLYMQMALGASPSENILTLTVNGKEVAVPASFTSVGAANWTTYESFWLANVDLVAGENTIVITVTGGCGNFDYLELMSPVEVTAAE